MTGGGMAHSRRVCGMRPRRRGSGCPTTRGTQQPIKAAPLVKPPVSAGSALIAARARPHAARRPPSVVVDRHGDVLRPRAGQVAGPAAAIRPAARAVDGRDRPDARRVRTLLSRPCVDGRPRGVVGVRGAAGSLDPHPARTAAADEGGTESASAAAHHDPDRIPARARHDRGRGARRSPGGASSEVRSRRRGPPPSHARLGSRLEPCPGSMSSAARAARKRGIPTWVPRTLHGALDAVAAEHPGRPFVLADEGGRPTPSSPRGRPASPPACSRRASAPGDRVALLLPNSAGDDRRAVRDQPRGRRRGAAALRLQPRELEYVLRQSARRCC